MQLPNFSVVIAQGDAVGKTIDAANKGMDSVTGLWSSITGAMGGQIGEFLPKFLGAAIILVVGWLIAKGVKWLLTNVIQKTGAGRKMSSWMGGSADEVAVSDGFGTAGFWTVMLFVAIACLRALDLDQVSEPLVGLLNKFFSFLPNVIGAGAMFAVAWLVATLAKFGVSKGLAVADIDNRLKLQPGTLTNSLPMAMFCFILLFFLPGILGALNIPELSGPVQGIVEDILNFLPNLLSAAVIIAITYFIAKLLGTLVTNLLGGIGFNNVPKELGLMSDTSNMSMQPSEMAGKGAFIVTLLLGISQAIENLQLEMVSNFFQEGWEFAMPVLIGMVILAVGLWLANLARKAISGSKMKNADLMSQIAFAAIMVLTGVVALKRMGLADGIIDVAFAAIIGGFALAGALAFGLGGRDAASRFLDKQVK